MGNNRRYGAILLGSSDHKPPLNGEQALLGSLLNHHTESHMKSQNTEEYSPYFQEQGTLNRIAIQPVTAESQGPCIKLLWNTSGW